MKVLATVLLTFGLAGTASALTILHPHSPGDHSGSPATAPEIDPTSALGAITLLVGGLAVIRGRKSKK